MFGILEAFQPSKEPPKETHKSEEVEEEVNTEPNKVRHKFSVLRHIPPPFEELQIEAPYCSIDAATKASYYCHEKNFFACSQCKAKHAGYQLEHWSSVLEHYYTQWRDVAIAFRDSIEEKVRYRSHLQVLRDLAVRFNPPLGEKIILDNSLQMDSWVGLFTTCFDQIKVNVEKAKIKEVRSFSEDKLGAFDEYLSNSSLAETTRHVLDIFAREAEETYYNATPKERYLHYLEGT